MTRLSDIKYQLQTGKAITVEDIEWLISQLEAMEEWRRKEIGRANDAYSSGCKVREPK